MTVIRPNAIAGITSLTAQADNITFHKSDGTLAGLLLEGVNFNTTSGVSTFATVNATSFTGDGSGLTGVASTDNIVTDTVAQFNAGVGIADSIFHIGDTNTAIRFPAADTFTVETGGSERARIDSSGRLLVGAISASYTATAVFEGNSGSSANQGQIHLFKGNTTVADGNSLGIVRFGATGDRRGADIRGIGDGTWTADSSHPTRLVFMTTAAGESQPTERLRITNAGLVGIGTDNPIMRLHVHGDANDASSRIRLSSAEGSGLTIRAQSATENNINADGGEDITFSRGNVESLRINSSGHIGINTVPSSWESGADTTALQIDGASVACINDRDLFTASNAYWDGGNWKYVQTGGACNFFQGTSSRVFTFRTAASGSADSNITWTNALTIDGVTGNLTLTGIGTAVQWDATSDIALKENIEVIDNPIVKLSELKGVTFDWKFGGHSVGVIAQDVEKVLPTAVGGSENRKTVNYNAIIGLLVESVKDQQKQIEELKSLLDK